MKRLEHNDGSWNELQQDWKKSCSKYGEEYANYTPTTMQLLAAEIENCSNDRWSGVYASIEVGKNHHEALAFLNAAHIPGYVGRVLRVRHLQASPEFDLGVYSAEQYANMLGRVFHGIMHVSDVILPCPHVKVHFRSPADAALFSTVAEDLEASGNFSDVKTVGAWLYISKLSTGRDQNAS